MEGPLAKVQISPKTSQHGLPAQRPPQTSPFRVICVSVQLFQVILSILVLHRLGLLSESLILLQLLHQSFFSAQFFQRQPLQVTILLFVSLSESCYSKKFKEQTRPSTGLKRRSVEAWCHAPSSQGKASNEEGSKSSSSGATEQTCQTLHRAAQASCQAPSKSPGHPCHCCFCSCACSWTPGSSKRTSKTSQSSGRPAERATCSTKEDGEWQCQWKWQQLQRLELPIQILLELALTLTVRLPKIQISECQQRLLCVLGVLQQQLCAQCRL